VVVSKATTRKEGRRLVTAQTAPHLRRVTMRDVAREAGVSIQTVSNFVNERAGRMNPETEAKVRSAIERLEFRPNSAAQGLRSQSRRTLAFVMNDSSHRFLGDPMTDLFLSGLGDELRERSYSLLIDSTKPTGVSTELVRSMAEGRADAAIMFLSGDASERATNIEALAKSTFPMILLQEHQAEQYGIPSIVAKDRRGSRELCRHLISRGHKRIAFLSAAQSWSAIEERVTGYREAHVEFGMQVVEELVVTYGEFKPLDAAAAASRLLDRRSPPTAVMCGNDLLALGVVKAAFDRGLRVPEDLAVTGFDDFDFAVATTPTLSTVRVAGYEMGRFAAQSLIRALSTDSTPVGAEFDIELCIRASS
jgi:DNA-binding LacI/PurR family transcriptional regulator